MRSEVLWLGMLSGILALVCAFIKSRWINKRDPGNEQMRAIGQAVCEEAMAFIARECKVLAIFVIAAATLLALGNASQGTSLVALSFIVGALCNGLSCFLGTRGNGSK